MALEWGVENPPEERAALVEEIASHYTERYTGTSLTGEEIESPDDLVEVQTRGCRGGLLRGLRELAKG